MLRELLDAAMARGVPVVPGMSHDEFVANCGFAYVCLRCDVYGYLGPNDAQMCWACEQADRVERR
jgi:hypothetical protein